MDAGVATFDALVIDDDDFARKTTIRALEKVGAGTTYHAAGGAQALAMLGTIRNIDVIICDLNMPGVDGVETLRRLSECHRTTRIILASSADSRVLRSAREMAAGFGLLDVQIMAKPVTVSKLRAAIFDPMPQPPARPVGVFATLTMADFLRGLAAGELTAHYQPQVAFATRTMIGVEALVRWQHPIHGLLAPGAFLPLAHQSGKMEELTRIVLDTAVAQCACWQHQGIATTVSVNLAIISLTSRDLPGQIDSILSAHALPPEKLILEVTEDGWLQQQSVAREVLTRLALRGLGLSIDDFGTAYSTPQQLLSAPFSELKLDQSFVGRALIDDASRIVLSSSIKLAHELKIGVVAEGIETAAQWDLLKQLNCDTAQGYFIARPMQGDALPAWKAQWDAAKIAVA